MKFGGNHIYQDEWKNQRRYSKLNLNASVADTPILKGINLTINPGEIHAIMGPNGSGKSTMSYVLSGRNGYEVTGGDVLIGRQSILEMKPMSARAQECF